MFWLAMLLSIVGGSLFKMEDPLRFWNVCEEELDTFLTD